MEIFATYDHGRNIIIFYNINVETCYIVIVNSAHLVILLE